MNWQDVARFAGTSLGPVRVLDEVDSTSAELFRLGQRGEAPGGLVLVARHQTAGRGSRGRPWHAAPDRAALVSVLLDPATPLPSTCSTLVGCVAVGDVLEELGVPGVTFKWPNDVLIAGRKVAGILAESRVQGMRSSGVVIGMGLNVGQSLEEFQEYPTPATSLRAVGVQVSTPEVVLGLLGALDRRLAALPTEGPDPLTARWLAGLGIQDRPAVLETTSGPRVGIVRGFLPTGHFLFEDPASGVRAEVPAGHVLAVHHGE